MSFFQSFRAARWLRSTNLLLQAILFVTLFVGLSYLALLYSWRFDLTHLRRHSLSAETGGYLDRLKESVRVVVTFPRDAAIAGNDAPADLDQINNDIAGLLREYNYTLESKGRPQLQIDYIDVNQRPRDAELLGLKPYAVYFLCGTRPSKEILLDDLYQRKDNQRVAFLGEQLFTAAILNVSTPDADRKTIYFLTGHGEMDLHGVDHSRGLSELHDALRDRNYKLATIDLSRTRAVPADTALLISIGAQNRYEAFEQEILRQYMSTRAGRLMVFATPGAAPTGLEDLLNEWGIIADNDRIYERATSGRVDPYSDLILTTDNAHDVTKILADNHLALKFGDTRSMRPNPGRAVSPGLEVTPLVLTSDSAWGEINYRSPRREMRYDAGADLPGPLAVVTVATRAVAKDKLDFSIPVGRIAAFGCSDFVANGRLGARANSTLFFSALNWLVETDTQLIIAARPIEKFQLALSRDQLTRLRYTLWFGVPGAFALFGLIVYWTRRR